MDLLIVAATCVAVGVRVFCVSKGEELTPHWAYRLHQIYIAVFMLLMMRTLQIFLFFSGMGPKILMLRGIFMDFIYFLSILLVFWMAYGVGSYALMRPLKAGVGLKSDAPTRGILDPYWALFGQNTDFAGELEEGDEMRRNDAILPTKEELREMTEVELPLVQAIYMLFGTFLLLNMIIALFSNTINSIDQDSQKIWKFSRIEMIYEYHEKTRLPPPFSLLSRIPLVFAHLVQRTCFNRVQQSWIGSL